MVNVCNTFVYLQNTKWIVGGAVVVGLSLIGWKLWNQQTTPSVTVQSSSLTKSSEPTITSEASKAIETKAVDVPSTPKSSGSKSKDAPVTEKKKGPEEGSSEFNENAATLERGRRL